MLAPEDVITIDQLKQIRKEHNAAIAKQISKNRHISDGLLAIANDASDASDALLRIEANGKRDSCVTPTHSLHIGIGEVTRIPVHRESVVEMKLWLLQRDDANWDEYDTLLIRAENEQEARKIACTRHTLCGVDSFKSPEHASCIEIKQEGVPKVIFIAIIGRWEIST